MGRFNDLAGGEFGRLLALQRVENHGVHTMWRVMCDCGKVFNVRAQHLRNGNTKSCGCLDRDMRIARNTKHSACGSAAYVSWAGMMTRCTNPNYSYYYLYGGRGIGVDPRWHDFAHFLEDMGERPPNTSLDRVDTNGMYTKSNCRWATPHEQSRNKRTNRWIEFGGERKIISDWARQLGVSAGSMCSYAKKYGDVAAVQHYLSVK